MTKHGFIFLERCMLIIFAFCTMAHSWECEQKYIRTYLGKKNIDICNISVFAEHNALSESLGDFMEKTFPGPGEFTEYITDKQIIQKMIKKTPYPDPYLNEIDIEKIEIVYDKKWDVISIRYQGPLCNPQQYQGLIFYFDKRKKVVRVHKFGHFGFFAYCTEYSKYKNKRGNQIDLKCGQIE